MASTTTTPGQNTCHFLQLPRELRDIIYVYALTEPQHLHFRWKGEVGRLYLKHPMPVTVKKSHGIQKRVRVPREANQLRYTSRQLYQETTGLGLALNDIVFETIADALFFFDACPKAYLQTRREFHITTTPVTETLYSRCKLPRSAHKIFRFCEEHPQITIWAPTELLNQRDLLIFSNAINWQERFRKSEDCMLLDTLKADPPKDYAMWHFGKLGSTGSDIPRNFRPVPSDGPFDRKGFLKEWSRRKPYSTLLTEGWLRAIEDIYANGI